MSEPTLFDDAGGPAEPWWSVPWCHDCQVAHRSGEHLVPIGDIHVAPQVHELAHDTERTAAELIAPKAGTWRAHVLAEYVADYLAGEAANGPQGPGDAAERGLTDEALVARLTARVGPAAYSTMRSRRKELVEAGWLRDSGLREDLGNGREAIVWELTPRASAAIDRGFRVSEG